MNTPIETKYEKLCDIYFTRYPTLNVDIMECGIILDSKDEHKMLFHQKQYECQMYLKYGKEVDDWRRFYSVCWKGIDEILKDKKSEEHAGILGRIWPHPN